MKITAIVPGVWELSFGGIKTYLVQAGEDRQDGLVLVDTGMAGHAAGIVRAVHELGFSPRDLRGIVVTHLHQDHTGGLLQLQLLSGAAVWMHPADAALLREGIQGRAWQPGGGLITRTMARVMSRLPARRCEPVTVDHEVADGETLPFAGLRVVYTPGHTLGHLSLLLPRSGGVLFVGDAASNWLRLRLSPINEDWDGAARSVARLAALESEIACFAHGRTIRHDAAGRFRELAARVASA